MMKQYAPLLSLFLIQGCTHCLCFLLSYIYSWLSSKPLQQLLTIPHFVVIYVRHFLKITTFFCINFDFCVEKLLFLKSKIFQKQFQNILKIILKCNSSVYFETIVVYNEPLNTKDLELIKRRSTFQEKNMSCEQALNFDQ